MQPKTVFAVALLLGAVTIAQAVSDQPHMTAALTALESAKNNLERATADKGGHRTKALDFVRDAIDQAKKGIDAAR